jgi:precorrin isomerase
MQPEQQSIRTKGDESPFVIGETPTALLFVADVARSAPLVLAIQIIDVDRFVPLA